MRKRRVGIRELKAKLSECVRDVKAGQTRQTIIVTERGRPVARIIPETLPETESLRERLKHLVRTGAILWSGRPFRPTKPVARLRGKRSLSDRVIEDRR
jgi:prevent-host-death family protein